MKGKIVIVESEAEEQEKWSSYLSNHGFKVECYSKTDGCINDIIQGFDPDALLIHHREPEIDALNCAHVLMEEHKLHVPIIVIAAEADIAKKAKFIFTPGVVGIHFAPIDLQIVKHSISQAAAQKQLVRYSKKLISLNKKLLESNEAFAEASKDILIPTASEEDPLAEAKIKKLRENLRGRDLVRDTERARENHESLTTRIEKVMRSICKN